ncbi:MAG: DUF4870 domain-containing protein [Streptosporangiales bacterium]|nr:DUF4870 domain-containing protein [Streptosporangiales bacterium]
MTDSDGQQAQPPPQQGPPGPYGQRPPGPGGWQPPAPVNPSDERTWAMLGHLGGILLGFIAPLIVYLVYKDRSAFLRRHGSQALNFQLTMLIGTIVGAVLTVVIIGILVLVAVAVVIIVFSIVAAMAANRGEDYKYPMTIQFVS